MWPSIMLTRHNDVISHSQAKVLDRDGRVLMECPKGWQYIADMANTDVRSDALAIIVNLL